MGGCVNLKGHTEKETILNEFGWLADWANTMMRHLTMAHKAMSVCASMGGAHYEYGENGPQTASMDALCAMLRGTLDAIDNAFEMQYMMGPEGLPTWKSLQQTFIEYGKQAKGLIPIPVEPSLIEAKPTKEPTNLDKSLFKKQLLEIFDLRVHLQSMLNKYYPNAEAHAPILQIQLKVTDREGRDVKLPVLNIEQIVEEEIKRQMDEKLKLQKMRSRMVDGGEPPETPRKE